MLAADQKRLLCDALVHHRAGRLEEAEGRYKRILQAQPNNADALNLLGALCSQTARPERAITLIRKALALAPNFAQAHMNLGNALRESGRAQEASDAYRRAIAERPTLVAAHINLGRSLSEQGHAEAAHAALSQALSLRPNETASLRDLAQLFSDLGALDDAQASLDQALAIDPQNASLITLAANMQYRRGKILVAVEQFRRAIALSPRDATCWNGLGRALRAAGQFIEARDCFRRALVLSPGFSDARRNLGLTGEIDESDCPNLRHTMQSQEELPANRIAAGFALGGILDHAKRYREAFEAYTFANGLCRLQQKGAGFDPAAFARFVDGLMERPVMDLRSLDDEPSELRQLPVFIVGMPRSGTSLVEQILASHSQVHGAGELRDIARIVGTLDKSAAATESPAAVSSQLALAHLRTLRTLSPSAFRVIDKMPDNIFHLHRIAVLFPGARIIFCKRDWRDVALSCFFTLFTDGNAFSTALPWCIQRQNETERLALHWQSALRLPMLEVQYEALVNNLEDEARRLVDFLGLSWEPACLRFWQTDRHVMTASSWQVRQKLFHGSVGRWRNYVPYAPGLQSG